MKKLDTKTGDKNYGFDKDTLLHLPVLVFVSHYYLGPSLFTDISSPCPPEADCSFLKLPKQLTWRR